MHSPALPIVESQLSDDEVHVWTARLDRPQDTQNLEGWRRLLSVEEKDRARRFVHPLEHERYVICHGIQRSILQHYTGVAAHELRFATNPFGKPHLDGNVGHPGLHFNLSHSGSRMLLGVVRGGRIGVDLEQVKPASASLEVAARFFTPRENEDLRSLSGEDQVQGFFNCWTRKEAYLKAIGCGLSVDPRDCEVSLNPGEEPRVLRTHTLAENPQAWTVFHCEPETSFVGAVMLDRKVKFSLLSYN